MGFLGFGKKKDLTPEEKLENAREKLEEAREAFVNECGNAFFDSSELEVDFIVIENITKDEKAKLDKNFKVLIERNKEFSKTRMVELEDKEIQENNEKALKRNNQLKKHSLRLESRAKK